LYEVTNKPHRDLSVYTIKPLNSSGPSRNVNRSKIRTANSAGDVVNSDTDSGDDLYLRRPHRVNVIK